MFYDIFFFVGYCMRFVGYTLIIFVLLDIINIFTFIFNESRFNF